MALAVALQMDPIERVDIDADSTFALGLEAQRRGHALRFYTPNQLAYRDGAVIARSRSIELARERGAHVRFGPSEIVPLDQLDVVLLRQDPPFDLSYVSTTHLLERIHPATLVVNDPTEVRNAPEKLFVLDFARFMPPSLVTRDRQMLEDFRREHGQIVVKPLYGNGGAGVFKLSADDPNLASLFETLDRFMNEPLMAQAFIPAISEGDKRIILVDGEPLGAINRRPPAGDIRANMHAGGRAEPAELTTRDREICEALGPELRKRGLIFTGIDVIGGMLTEINVTSPTGLQEILRFGGLDLAARIWDVIEAKRG